MSDSKDPKYEREIRDLLDRMPEFLPQDKSNEPVRLHRYRAERRFRPWVSAPRLSLSARNAAIAFFVALGLSYVIRPISPQIASYLGVLSVVLLTLGLALAVLSRRQGKYERRWRGRVITLPSDTPRWRVALEQRWWRLKQKWRRRRG